MSRKTFSLGSITRAVAFLFVFSVPFTTKKLIHPFQAGASEWTSVFLYGMDIALIVLAALLAWRRFKGGRAAAPQGTRAAALALGAFLLAALASVALSASFALSLYAWVRLVVAILSGIALAYALLSGALSFAGAALALGLSAVLQSVIGFLQFTSGSSVGLRFLGESVITPATTGVARVIVSGVAFLRAYGTMQHANILAGFLGLGFLAFLYLWFRIPERKRRPFGAEFLARLALAFGIFVVTLGLVLTFSRSGWIAAAAGALCFFGFALAEKGKARANAVHVLGVAVAVAALSAAVMWWAVAPRVANLTAEDPSVNYRLRYDIMGMRIMEQRPLGVGIGNQVDYSVARHSYQTLGITRPIDWQPIHNLYILVASETGLLGLALFLLFLGILIMPRLRAALADKETAAALALLALLLVFGLFDHFLWTLESGRLMLWFAIALVFAADLSQARNRTADA